MTPRQAVAIHATTSGARKIAANSAAIYARTLASIVLALLGSRWTFLGLGQNDLGIFTVVTGLVGFLGILTGAMTQSAQRFLAFGATGEDPDAITRYFNASLAIHLILAGLSLVLGLTIGAWAMKHVLQIPPDRMGAALLVYHCVLGLAVVSIATVPVSAIFAARQRFGLMSILETAPTFVSAGVAFTLRYVSGDRLAYYALATTGVAIVFIGLQVLVASRVFSEVRLRWPYLKDWKTIRSIIAFSAWNLFGIVASILSRQGSSVLVNVFGGAPATAAFGLAGQATNQAATLTVGVIRATYPEVVSREGRGDRESSIRLALLTTKYTTLLTLMWMMPLYAEVDHVLGIWLGSVPEHTGEFARLLMLVILFDNMSAGYPIIVQSIGRVAAYQTSVGLLVMLAFPISYLLLRQDAALAAVPAVVACVTFVQMLLRVAWGWRLAKVSPAKWAREVVGRGIASFIVPLGFLIVMAKIDNPPWASVVLSSAGSVLLGTIGVLRFGLTPDERTFIIGMMKRGIRTRPSDSATSSMKPAPMEMICLWLNFPSIHQAPLIRALAARGDLDVQVRYFDQSKALEERRSQGWESPTFEPYESFTGEGDPLPGVPGYKERVHLLPGIGHPLCRGLLSAFEQNGIDWCHWGERAGIRFSSLVHAHPGVLRRALPAVNRLLHGDYARRINASSLGAFAIGTLAEEDFVTWGVRRELIRHLYYSPEDVRQGKPLGESPEADGVHPMRFIYLGSVYREKGIGTMLRAFSALGGNGWRLAIVGKDLSKGRYRRLASRLGIDSFVRWVGPVPSTEVGQWLDSADVLVLPSLFDGWGAVLNEGASAGKALIATTQCGAAWHVIVPGSNGYRVAPASVRELSATIAEYLRRPGLAQVHGRASRALFEREFTAVRNAERLIAAVREWKTRRRVGRMPNA